MTVAGNSSQPRWGVTSATAIRAASPRGKPYTPVGIAGKPSARTPRSRANRQAGPVAARQDREFAVSTAAPDRADGMNDVPSRQPIAARQPSLPRRAAAERAAFREQLGAGGAMDRAVDTAAAEQRGIGGVDDRVD